MKPNAATAQSVSALELLKRKYAFSLDTLSNTPIRQIPKSIHYHVPELALLYIDEASAETEKFNHSWLELHLGITEVAGEGGSGKTQICLGLCISCVMQSYNVQYTSNTNSIQVQRIPLQNHELNLDTATQLTSGQSDALYKQHSSKNPYLTSKSLKQSPLTKPSSSFTSSLSTDSSSQSIGSKSICTNPYLKITNHHFLEPSTHAATCPLSNSCNTNTWTQNQTLYTEQSPQSSNIGEIPSKRYFYKAIYISMGEGVSEAQRAYRLNQIYTSRRQTFNTRSLNDTVDLDTALSRILSRNIYNEEEFHEWLFQQLPDMLSSHNSHLELVHPKTQGERIGVIIIDSMAGLFRISDQVPSSSWYVRRSGLLFQAAAQLKKLSFQYHVPVVVVNQVSGSEQGPSIPALGLSWSHCINHRFMISRREEYVSDEDKRQEEGRTRFVRHIQLLLSPQYPSQLNCSFTIDNTGCKLK